MLSNLNIQKEVKVTLLREINEIKGFVTAVHNNQWWVGYVFMYELNYGYNVSIMHETLI